MAMSGLSRVRTELFQLLVIPSLAHHPVQAYRQFARHGHLGDLPSPPHGQVDILNATTATPQVVLKRCLIRCSLDPRGDSDASSSAGRVGPSIHRSPTAVVLSTLRGLC